jgi:predicted metal-dependent phosphoesterase TrpH
MPSSFTRLCQLVAGLADSGRADLHVHTTHSDGLFTPEEVVERARRAGLVAVAITDHDTLSGVAVARAVARGIEVITGVEITAEYQGRELHLLGYFVRPDNAGLSAALAAVRRQRGERFELIAGRLRGAGLSVEEEAIRAWRAGGATLGRRHLARMLVESRQAGSLFDAFSRHLNTPEIQAVPKLRLPVAAAITLVKDAGGVSSWAHPPSDVTEEQLRELRAFGLGAVEAEYPWPKPAHGKRLRELAREIGLTVTGGSDCHGPQPNSRAVGAKGVSRSELDRIRALCA